MKKTIHVSVLATLCLFLNANAQTSNQTKPLNIGEQLPELTISNVLNYKSPSLKLSDFRGKLLLIDFWATWCSPCITMIPKMNALQKQFAGKIQFLPVTYQSRNELAAFSKRYRQSENLLPEVFADRSLSALFPYTYLPHYIWIDASGKILNITGFEAVTSENIQAALSGSKLTATTKKDVLNIPYDPEMPLFSNGNGGDGRQIIGRSVFSNYVAGLPGSDMVYPNIDGTPGVHRIVVTNGTIGELFRVAYGEHKIFFGQNRILLNVRDSSNFLNPGNITEAEWMQQNHVFNYELSLPPALSAGSFSEMQRDLQFYFPQYTGSVKKLKRKCLTLVRTSAADKLRSAGGTSEFTADVFGMHIRNSYLAGLIGRLNVLYLQLSPMPVIDKTGYTEAVDMTLDANLGKAESINNALARYDLQLKESEEEIEMLVISDKTSNPNP
jgi:thiol-disulfide isomerase/thioredoxin